jgi:nitrite reductase/ring-hydroxylating ferredoxin subunit
MAEFLKAATTQDVSVGHAKMVKVGGKHIALFNVEGNYYAIDDTCTHKGGPLSQGEVTGSTVTCPWHGATFDLRTGEVVRPPAAVGVYRYKVRVSFRRGAVVSLPAHRLSPQFKTGNSNPRTYWKRG